MRMRRTGLAVAILALALTGTAACSDGGSADDGNDGAKGTITIGAFNFSESEIVANLYADLLEKAGYETEVKALGAREVVEPALEKGDIQLVPEYLGSFTTFLNSEENGADAPPAASSDFDATLSAAKELAEPRGLVVLPPAAGQNTNAFAVTEQFSSDAGITTLSELAAYDGDIVLGGGPECPERPLCQPGLEETYGITFADFQSFAEFSLIPKAVVDGDIQLGLVFSTDASIAANNLVVLEDDKNLQTVENITPVVNKDANSDDLAAALAPLVDALTTDALVELNNQVDNERETPANAAEAWLKDQGLI
jgi:osmoprotectant transport system substrate-binding protein